jgi:hypothetical protein
MKGAVARPIPANESSENLMVFNMQTIVAVCVANRIQHAANPCGIVEGFQRRALEKWKSRRFIGSNGAQKEHEDRSQPRPQNVLYPCVAVYDIIC